MFFLHQRSLKNCLFACNLSSWLRLRLVASPLLLAVDVGEERDEWVVVVDVDGGERSVYTVT